LADAVVRQPVVCRTPSISEGSGGIFLDGGLLNALDSAEPVNAVGGDPEPLADQPIRHAFTSKPPNATLRKA